MMKVIRVVLPLADTSPSAPPPDRTRRMADSLLFEVTDATIVREGASRYVVSFGGEQPDVEHLAVVQSGQRNPTAVWEG